MQRVPLNQTYKQDITFEQYPNVRKIYDEITEFATEREFVNEIDGHKYPKGCRYDYSLLFNNNVNFVGKTVCEVGARDSIFGSWLTKYADKVYVSDYFEEWGKDTEHDLGDLDHWKDVWTHCAVNSDRLVMDCEDITKMSYPDNFFDVVICTSVIEHLFTQCKWMGDMKGIREIVRITKPGGKILLSTDMAEETKWISGTLYYSEADLFDRIINPSRCFLNGQWNFKLDDPNNTDVKNIDDQLKTVSPVVLSLVKPLII